MTNPAPNPGSPEAVKRGCTCSARDNQNGKGCYRSPFTGEWMFWIDDKCPLHGAKKEEKPK